MSSGAPGGPLDGRRVVVTRAEGQGGRLAAHLRSLGAPVVEVPLIAIEPVAADPEIRAAVERLRRHPPPRWIAVTSANAAQRLRILAAEEVAGFSFAAVGEATATALAAAGLPADLVAAGQGGEALADAMLGAGAGEGSVWLPQAEAARPELAERLRAAGAEVEVTACYRTVPRREAGPALGAALAAGVAALVLLSPSAAGAAVDAVGVAALRDVVLVCGGETTAVALRGMGLRPVVAAGAGPEQVATALLGALRA
jgi:uroporphyrinogen-III synthase